MKYLKITDWEKHQHYKDRNPPWIKLHNSLLLNYEFSTLSDASKLHLMLLWLLASQLDNKIPADEGWIKENIKCKGKVDLEPLETLGFIELYQDASRCVQVAIPETETEGEKEREAEKISLDFEGAKERWNILVKDLSIQAISKFTEKRKKQYTIRCREVGGEEAFWAIVKGEIHRLNEFTLNNEWFKFDFLLTSEDNFTKFAEGQYRATTKKATKQGRFHSV